MSKEKTIEEEKEITLITTEGKEVIISYKIDSDIDDFVLEEIREALGSNGIYHPEDWVTIEFGGKIILELDFKKIIGINWF